MVTIKIQSREDIIGAYLKSLGFDDDTAVANSEKVSGYINQDLSSGDDIIASLDKLVLTSATKIWPLGDYSPEQLIALFKLLYLLNNGVKNWGIEIFNASNLPTDMVKVMSEHNLCQAPNYAFAKMEPQKIEPVVPQNWLHKLLKFSSKKA